jgi:hypothetical protein
VAIAAVSLLAVTTGTLFALQSPSQASVLHIQQLGDQVTVDLVNPSATPKQVAKELRHVGINAHVTSVPVPGPLVGQFVQTVVIPKPSDPQPVALSQGSYRSFHMNVNGGANVQLRIGRPAKPGESFTRYYDAFAQGGPFYCTTIFNKRVVDEQATVTSLMRNVTWQSSDASGSPGDGSANSVKDQYIIGGIWVGPDTAVMTTSLTPAALAVQAQASPVGCS